MADGGNKPLYMPKPGGPVVAFCIPSSDDWSADTGMTVASLMHWCALRGIHVGLMNQVQTVISASRNAIVMRALNWPQVEPTHVFMLDSDMMVPHDTIERLLDHDKDIACATYNRRRPPYQTLGILDGQAKDITGGLHKALFMPGGVMLIKIEVFKKLAFPWFFETYEWAGETPSASFIKMLADWSFIDLPLEVRAEIAGSKVLRDWLDADATERKLKFDPEARMISEDYNFCRKARKAGFEIWCDFDLSFQTIHIGTHRVTCMLDKERKIPTDPALANPLEAVNAGGV